MSPILGGRGAGVRAYGFGGAGAPGQVTGLTATDVGNARAVNNGRIDLSWTAPSSNGAPITGYKIDRSTDGTNYTNLVASTGSSTTTYSNTGLTSAQIYYYRVAAINAVATGINSSPASATATTIPAAPTIGTASCATGQAYTGSAIITVPYTAGVTGGKTVTYTATSSGGGTATGASPISLSQTVGQPASTARTYTVTATNSNGSAVSAASNSVAAISVPQAPTITSVSVGNATATIFYTANATGGAGITSYNGLANPGNIQSLYGSGTNVVMSPLVNGTAYTLSVAAVNSAGRGAYTQAAGTYTPTSPAWINLTASNGGAYGVAGEIPGDGFVYAFDGRGSHGTVFKYNNLTGALVSQRQLIEQFTFAANKGVVYDGTVDSSGNIYICGNAVNGSSTSPMVAKYDSSLNLLWAKRTSQTAYAGVFYNRIHVDSSGNVYVGGSGYNYSNAFGIWAKYNSSGVFQYGNQSFGGDSNFQPGSVNGLATDSSGNFYVLASHFSGGTTVLFKYGPSGGSILAQRELYTQNTNYKTANCDLVVDPSGNVYVLTLGNSQDSYISKFDSSLNLQWQVATTSNPSLEWPQHKIHVDSSGSVYMIGHRSNTQAHILKWNSGGGFLFQRQIDACLAADLKTIGNDMIFFGRLLNNNSVFMLRVPNDGSKTGTYTVGGVTRTYQASSLPIGANIATLVRTSSYTISTSTGVSTSDISPTLATPTFVSNTVAI
jgi:hypothetical protein